MQGVYILYIYYHIILYYIIIILYILLYINIYYILLLGVYMLYILYIYIYKYYIKMTSETATSPVTSCYRQFEMTKLAVLSSTLVLGYYTRRFPS